jgi:hypothetical protein
MSSALHWHPGGCVPCEAFAPSRTFLRTHSGRVFLVEALLLCLVCASCGAVGSSAPADPPPAAVTISVSPSAARIFLGQSMTVTAAVQNAASPELNWQVQATAGGNSTYGTIVSTGSATATYTAPASGQTPQTVTITAVLQSDSTKSGSATITVDAITGPLRVSPAVTSITTSQASQAIQFQVLTPGVTANDVSWQSSGGTITPGGLFSPPNVPGIYTIVASIPSTSGSATVAETDFPGTFTWRNDNMRSGINSQELALTPATVSPSTFGKLFSCPIDGYAYAQPLYVPNLAINGLATHNVVFVATENDSLFAFDADSRPCAQLWQTSLAGAGQPVAFPNLDMINTDIVPFAGITGTPVIDPGTWTLYVVAATQTIASLPTYAHSLYALDLTTVPPLSVQSPGIEITSSGSSAGKFDSVSENQRAALLLAGGALYVAFSSYGGLCVGTSAPCPYHGWIFGYDTATLALRTPAVFNDSPSPFGGGGIWESGGGPSADKNGNIFLTTGDGPYGPTPDGMNYSDSFLRLGSAANGTLSVGDSFTPCAQTTLETTAEDVATGAPVLLPDSALQPSLLIGGSKSGTLYVVNRDSMGGFCPASASSVQTVITGGGPIDSTPLFWNNCVYVAPGNGNLLSFSMPGGFPASCPSISKSSDTLGPDGATPVMSWNASSGMTNTGILWMIDSSGAEATPNSAAILRAYDPNNLSNEIYNSDTVLGSRNDNAGHAVKFTVPTVANGKVYVGTQTELDVYGLLP